MGDAEQSEVLAVERSQRMLALQLLIQLPEKRDDAQAVLKMVHELLENFVHKPGAKRPEQAKPSLKVV